ncbi:MAG TPA: excinuclease ABC subunit UvrC [Paludibacter sp.]|nr:excinuclease ABC subunit UvrC [Prolixibacteraceae bacterium]
MKSEGLFSSKLKEIVSGLPDLPGIYQYFNSEGKIIYVGKAKNLKKRVSSYFSKVHDNRKTAILVRKIADIKHMVVDSEEDALLLENNLIKKYQPRYNVLLKDDKSFPWICIKNESFPRVFFTRNVIRDGSLYFGPYTSIPMVRTILDVIKRLYPIRNCSLNLSKENIAKLKYKVCLEFQIGNCKGPCESLQHEDEYLDGISQIKEILKGNLSTVVAHLKGRMNQFAQEYKFEEAENIKNKITILENYKSKSTIVSSSITNVDVFSFEEDELYGYVNFLRVVDGAIIQAHTLEIKKRLDESKEELLALGIIEIRQKFFLNSKELILPFKIDIQLKEVKMIVPQIGDKRKLLELSERNVKFYKLDKNKQLSLKTPQSRTDRLLEQIKKDLRLQELPNRIECFDNSNIQGAQPVAACVVFIGGKPAKREYRHFNVKTVVGPDDFASMEEIIFRRYDRVINEKGPLPQLIVVDGGKGQLSSAISTLERLDIRGKVAVIGIAKKLEEIIYPDDPIPLYLDKNSETLRVLQNIRNEAHRFGITFHRNKRSKEFIISELSQIPGIGDKTIEMLMRKFKSIKRLKETPESEIISEIGVAKAEKIENYFKDKVE